MVQAQIGNSPNVGIFILLLGFFISFFIFFGDVVDTRLIHLAVGIDHQGSVAATGVTLALHVALFLAITAHNIGIASAVVSGRGGVGRGGACWSCVVVAEQLLTADGYNLVNLLVSELVPEDGIGLIWRQDSFNSRNLFGHCEWPLTLKQASCSP
jgi:hypothetical protein